MRAVLAALSLASWLWASAGCRKKPEELGGDLGPGWAVGAHGLVVAFGRDGAHTTVELEVDVDLFGLACRGADSVFVVGARGAFLRSFDGGIEWEPIDLGTRGALRSISAAARDVLAVAGEEGLYLSVDSGTSWTTLATGAFAQVAVDRAGEVIMALDRQGTIWREDKSASLRPILSATGATAFAMSDDGEHVAIVRDGRTLLASHHAGSQWQHIELGEAHMLRSVVVGASGEVVAVGAEGAVVRVSASGEVVATRVGRADLQTVAIDAAGRGFVIGGGALWQTSDGGARWMQLGARWMQLGASPAAVAAIDQRQAVVTP